ncbi:MAG: hypothetical protein LW875_00090 [Proteobacteria bacterium]|nr:hypothetical protein [Pseudomonadota bacterium]
MTTFLFILSQLSFAQIQPSVVIKPNVPVTFEYISPAWNKAPSEIDSGYIVVRDSKNGNLVKAELRESEVNSALFQGTFGIGFSNRDFSPEIYIIPKEYFDKPDQLKILFAENRLSRKPIFLKADSRSQKISIYDTSDQAFLALGKWKSSQKSKTQIVDPSVLEAQRKLEVQKELERLQKMEAEQEKERARLAEQEVQRRAQLKAAEEKLAAEEIKKRKVAAQKLAEEGLKHYSSGNFQEAEAKFNQAVELDPSEQSFYYQYGVTLYRNEKFSKSLVVLRSLPPKGSFDPNEKEYFMGLNYLKLKEFSNAREQFARVQAKDVPQLSPSSAFFVGVIDFQTESFESAKSQFEYVLDKSTDAQLDRQAEAYLDQIANIMAFNEERKKKWIISFYGGLTFDSNIQQISNSQIDSGSSTGLEGFRWSYGTSVEYRPLYNEKNEFSLVASASDIYSTDTSFQAKGEFQNLDPLTVALTAPFKWKGQSFSKPSQTVLTPGYETIMMNLDGTGSRETIVNTLFAKIDQTLVVKDELWSNYSFEVRSDESQTSSTGDDDQTAMRYTVATTQTFFQDDKKEKAWIADSAVTMNQAKGRNQEYNKIELGAAYLSPRRWETNLRARIGYFISDYGNHSTGRKDNQLSLSGLIQKKVNESVSGTLSLSYIDNGSTLSSSDYDKYTIGLGLSWDFALKN